MFSKTFGYAIRAVVFIGMHGQNGKRIGLQELSNALEIPHHFLGKILQDLVRHGFIDSAKGPNGGFYINDRTFDTLATEVLQVTDGTLVLEQCALGIRRCNAAHPCLMHHDFAACKQGMVDALSSKTIRHFIEELEQGQSFIV